MMRTRTWMAIVLLAACGGGSAAPDAFDVDAEPPRCAASAPFTSIEHLVELSSADREGSLRFSRDMLSAWVTRVEDGNRNLMVSTRASTADPFPAPVDAAGFAGADGEGHPSFTGDGLRMFFEYETVATAELRVHAAVRASTAEPFGPHAAIPTLDLPAGHPWTTADGSALYLAAWPDIVRAPRRPDGTFEAPVLVVGIDEEVMHAFPVLSEDERVIYFARTDELGREDIFVATRDQPTAAFAAPALVAELDTPGNNRPNYLSADLCTLYFTGDRDDTFGDLDAYAAHRDP